MEKRNTKKVALSVLALGAATAAVVFGSWASWSAVTTNPGNSVTAGTLTMTNSKNGLTVWTVPFSSIKPGETGSNTVTLTNTGTEDLSSVTLKQSAITDFVGDASNALQLKIHDDTADRCIWPTDSAGACAGFGAWTTTGALAGAGFAIKDNGGTTDVWSGTSPGPAEAHTFTISWNFTNGGSVDNGSQGDTATFDLTWTGLQ
jgi:predicted ribosomally synthesized peptide with SipW-like signal peptide